MSTLHAIDLQAALKRAGFSQQAIAAEMGVSKATVSHVLTGKARSRRLEQRVSEILDLPLYAIWPDYYERPEDLQTYRKGRAVTNEGAEQIMLGLWRRLDPASQLRVLSMMNEILGDAPAAKPGSEGIASARGRSAESHNTVSVGTNSGQVNTASKVINRGKK